MCLLNKIYSHLPFLKYVNIKAENNGVAGLFLSNPPSLFLSMLSFRSTNLIMSWSTENLWWPTIACRVNVGVEGSLRSASSLPLQPHFPSWMHWFTHTNFSPLDPIRFFHAFLCSVRLISFPCDNQTPFHHLTNTCLPFRILLSKTPSAVKPLGTYLC